MDMKAIKSQISHRKVKRKLEAGMYAELAEMEEFESLEDQYNRMAYGIVVKPQGKNWEVYRYDVLVTTVSTKYALEQLLEYLKEH